MPRKSYNIRDFFSRQLALISSFGENFSEFRDGICQLVLDTCKSTFAANGFNYEEYAVELDWLAYVNSHAGTAVGAKGNRRGSSSSSDDTLSRRSSRTSMESSPEHPPQPRKMTFMEQVSKRKVCERLVTFLRLIDYLLRLSLHNVACNSLAAIHKALVARAAKSRCGH